MWRQFRWSRFLWLRLERLSVNEVDGKVERMSWLRVELEANS
jgi:hypothetical protein